MEQKEIKLEPGLGAVYSSGENLVAETADLLELLKLTDDSENNGTSVAATHQLQRTVIWQGILEWTERIEASNHLDFYQTWQAPFTVTGRLKDGEPEVKASSWPMKGIMQLMHKLITVKMGFEIFKNFKSVVFFPSQCEALESLIKSMTSEYAGIVCFSGASRSDVKVLMLMYVPEKQTFYGIIPEDERDFYIRLRTVIKEEKSRAIDNCNYV